jgi:hypothetical protein
VFSQVLKFIRSVLKVVFKLLKRHNQEITLDDYIQISNKVPLKKLGNLHLSLSLNLRRGRRRFCS